jgi:hypothetical protein
MLGLGTGVAAGITVGDSVTTTVAVAGTIGCGEGVTLAVGVAVRCGSGALLNISKKAEKMIDIPRIMAIQRF